MNTHWKCSCGKDNEMAHGACAKCSISRPAYFGLQFDLPATQFNSPKEMSQWHLQLAYDYLLSARKTLKQIFEVKNRRGVDDQNMRNITDKFKAEVRKLNSHLEQVKNLDDKVHMFTEHGDAGYTSLLSTSLSLSGEFYFYTQEYKNAIGYYKKSYEVTPSQESLYYIARCVQKMDVVTSTKLFGKGDTRTKLYSQKKERMISLFKQALLFDPYSEIGINAARILSDTLNVQLNPQELREEFQSQM